MISAPTVEETGRLVITIFAVGMIVGGSHSQYHYRAGLPHAGKT